MDPLAEKYYPISTYAYVANNPIIYIDPDGRQITFTTQHKQDDNGEFILDKNGNKILTGVTMHVTGVVMNVSTKKVNLVSTARRISSQIEESFIGEMSDGVTFTTEVNLRVAESMNEVKDSDHIFALADMLPRYDIHGQDLGTHAGAANYHGGKVAFIDIDIFRGPWDSTVGNVGPNNAAHEFGHLSLAVHPGTHSKCNCLMYFGNGTKWHMNSSKVPSDQLSRIYGYYQRNMLNQGSNWERGRLMVKRPNRGMAMSFVKYGN